MSLTMFGHPFSSYCQKVLVALYENQIPFDFRILSPGDSVVQADYVRLWPLKRMPLLVHHGRPVMESSVIVEYLDLHFRGPIRWLPDDPSKALDVRMLDRFFDCYVMAPMQKIVFDALRDPTCRDPSGVEDAHALLETSYAWLEGMLSGREWASGACFSLADCAAAPALFYADWVHPMDEKFAEVRGYRRRLLERPSFARAVDEARPYRSFFPLGAPDRD